MVVKTLRVWILWGNVGFSSKQGDFSGHQDFGDWYLPEAGMTKKKGTCAPSFSSKTKKGKKKNLERKKERWSLSFRVCHDSEIDVFRESQWMNGIVSKINSINILHRARSWTKRLLPDTWKVGGRQLATSWTKRKIYLDHNESANRTMRAQTLLLKPNSMCGGPHYSACYARRFDTRKLTWLRTIT